MPASLGATAGIELRLATVTIVTAMDKRAMQASAHANALRHSCLVVIPALNEEATIGDVVRNLRRHGFEHIRVIDNGSSDATPTRAGAAGAEVLRESTCGYGQACRRGLENIPRGIAWILFCDADGSDDLDDVDPMVTAAEDADLVLSNRFATKEGCEAMTRMQRLGNRLVSKVVEYGWSCRFCEFGPVRLYVAGAVLLLAMSGLGF